ncbi:hypothetical protein RhiirA4_484556 [Rhizophagus irregularis]|uniref:Uncharacterized protein n=1 Tax=Rhizophagus irregularis TaxID=588596 RepID=A0A2I1HP95_9GLOM|nr:hypothetical protein RhiirA4_484556 [Rhizophagus irregularis]
MEMKIIFIIILKVKVVYKLKEDWDSEVENAMDDNDIIDINKYNENNNSNFNVNFDFNKIKEEFVVD